MRKKVLGSLAVLSIAAMTAFNVNMNSQENGLSDVSLANVEALAFESSNNSGSAEVYDCAGWFTGSKKIYMCRNGDSCTETECF